MNLSLNYLFGNSKLYHSDTMMFIEQMNWTIFNGCPFLKDLRLHKNKILNENPLELQGYTCSSKIGYKVPKDNSIFTPENGFIDAYKVSNKNAPVSVYFNHLDKQILEFYDSKFKKVSNRILTGITENWCRGRLVEFYIDDWKTKPIYLQVDVMPYETFDYSFNNKVKVLDNKDYYLVYPNLRIICGTMKVGLR